MPESESIFRELLNLDMDETRKMLKSKINTLGSTAEG